MGACVRHICHSLLAVVHYLDDAHSMYIYAGRPRPPHMWLSPQFFEIRTNQDNARDSDVGEGSIKPEEQVSLVPVGKMFKAV